MQRVGIAGVGKFGKNHTRILSKNENCEFIGLYDIDSKRANEIGEKYKTAVYKDYDQLLAKIDILIIVVTTISHYELAKKALENGIHVFIEKPITAKLRQAKELVQLADEKGLKIQVGHIERFNPVVLEIEDKIKDPIFIECHRIAPFTPRGTDVPVVLELMIHDIDLILSFVHNKVKNISASGSSVMTKKIDIANARIEFENGAVANVTSSRISLKRSRKLRFFQKDSYFSLDFQSKKVKCVKKSKKLYKVMPKIMLGKYEGIDIEDVVDIKNIDSSEQMKDSLTIELESFIKAVEEDTKPIVDGKAGARALEIALKIVEEINK